MEKGGYDAGGDAGGEGGGEGGVCNVNGGDDG